MSISPASQHRIGAILRHIWPSLQNHQRLCSVTGGSVRRQQACTSGQSLQFSSSHGTIRRGEEQEQEQEGNRTAGAGGDDSMRLYWRALHRHVMGAPQDSTPPPPPPPLTMSAASTGNGSGDADPMYVPDDVVDRLVSCYRRLPPMDEGGTAGGRARFLDLMATHFGTSLSLDDYKGEGSSLRSVLDDALRSVDSGKGGSVQALRTLRRALQPRYEPFLQNLVRLPSGGIKLIADMRADLLWLIRTRKRTQERDPVLLAQLSDLDASMLRILSSWFSQAYLRLERLRWSEASASICEKIIRYEQVHPMKGGWSDLKRRMGAADDSAQEYSHYSGRDPAAGNCSRLRMYGFVHPVLPNLPIAFIQVALMEGIPPGIAHVLPEDGRDKIADHGRGTPSVAVFYSVMSTQKGLQGIDLGNMLIKRVVAELQVTDPYISKFCTLSPIPGFMAWLNTKLSFLCDEGDCSEGTGNSGKFRDENLLHRDEKAAILSASATGALGQASAANVYTVFRDMVQRFTGQPRADGVLHDLLRPILMRLCARYLVLEKKRKRALDPVANFHIRNGAVMYRLNWLGDMSAQRMSESAGIMVNYLYRVHIPDDIAHNSQRYISDGTMCVEPGVSEWLPQYKSEGL